MDMDVGMETEFDTEFETGEEVGLAGRWWMGSGCGFGGFSVPASGWKRLNIGSEF